MHLVIAGKSYRDLEELTPTQFYRSLRQDGSGPHSTSAPSAGEYLSAFQTAPGDVLCLTVATEISGMHQAAAVAAGMVDDRRVMVIDTRTAAGGLRLLALRAAALAARGAGLDQVAGEVSRLAPRIRMYGVLDTVEHLARSGRVPQVASWGQSLLGVKPVIRFQAGRGSLVTLVRGSRAVQRALLRVLTTGVRKDGPGRLHATVFHADLEADAQALLEAIRETVPDADISISEFTPAMGVHTGPGLIGHAFYVEPPDFRPA